MNKGLKITLIIILSILVIGIIAFLIFALTNKSFKFSFNIAEYKEIAIDEQYDNIYDKITIDSKAAKITIKETDEDKIKVIVYADKEKTKVEKNNNALRIINDIDGCRGFCFKQTIAKIELYLPSTYSNTLTINNNFGDIDVADFDNLTLNIDEDAGNIKIGHIKNGNIENNAGNITIAEAENLTINEDAGNIEIGKVTNKLDIKEDAGNIKIDTIDIKENSNIKNDLGNIEIGKTNKIKIEAHTDLGSSKVNDSDSSSEITLTIKNDCGNITVN